MANLSLQVNILSHCEVPFPFSEEEVPASIILSIVLPNSAESITVFDIKWDAICIMRWFLSNKAPLFDDLLPIQIRRTGSIATSIARFYDVVSPDDLNVLDMVLEYRSRHELGFAMRGVDIPEIYLGNNDGYHEISHCDDVTEWAYRINLANFFNELESIARTKFSRFNLLQ